jgi:SAM-dependent methyltransferase
MALMVGAPPPGRITTSGSGDVAEGAVGGDGERAVGGHGLEPLGHHHRPVLVVELPQAGLAEIGRVLRPGGRALIWDFRPGVRPHPFGPRHAHLPDPVEHTRSSRLGLGVVKATPWSWPWRLQLTQRMELARADRSASLNPP